jgi:hypothetical protein
MLRNHGKGFLTVFSRIVLELFGQNLYTITNQPEIKMRNKCFPIKFKCLFLPLSMNMDITIIKLNDRVEAHAVGLLLSGFEIRRGHVGLLMDEMEQGKIFSSASVFLTNVNSINRSVFINHPTIDAL